MSLRSHSPTIVDHYRFSIVNTTARSVARESMWPSNCHRVDFVDFVDLQTRLVLLPRVEEEGIGAVIANLEPATCEHDIPHQHTAEPSQENRDEDGEEGTGESKRFQGYSLVGLESQEEDWSDKEFTEILALLREEEQKPLILVFAAPESTQDKPAVNDEEELIVEPIAQDSTCSVVEIGSYVEGPNHFQPDSTNKTTVTSQDSLQVGMSVLSSWGIRMRAQATEAANSLSTVAKEHAKNFQSPLKDASGDNKHAIQKPCDIFIQTSVGAFVPVAVAQSKVTTSSLLLVRKSATEPAPPSGWSFQWFRSSFPKENWVDETASVSSGASRSSTSSSGATPEASAPTTEEEIEWILLEGATHAAFQPDATIIGRKLRCIVTMEPEEPVSGDDSSDFSEDVDLAQVQASQRVCEISGVVSADSTLFNAARQALARGAKFGGLNGRGNAAGRQFQVEISIGMPSKKRSRHTTSSVQIFQMSGQERVSLTPSPIFYVTAQVPTSNPKYVDLQIMVSPESVLSALCTNNVFQLEAPNRLARESFLMTLGIANYAGKPANLNAQIILFKDKPLQHLTTERNLMDDDVSISSSSCASAVHGLEIGQASVGSQSPSRCPISPISTLNTLGTPTHSRHGTPLSVNATKTSAMEEGNQNQVLALEQELNFLRGKLVRKDKVVSQLQRQLTKSDAAHEQTQQELKLCQQELKQSRDKQDHLAQLLQKADGHIKAHEVKILKLEGDHFQKVAALESHSKAQNSKITDLEKANRSLQNEKAVLQATVEARESKLTRMAELQSSFEELSVKVAQHDALRSELETSHKRYEEIQQDLHKVETIEKECRSELANAKQSIEQLSAQIDQEREKSRFCQSELDPLQKKIQQLKGERNSFKHKNESLAKELSRICKNGRTIKDVERILADFDALLDEVETLRKQKRKALEDAHTYRTSYAQSKAAHELSGVEKETRAALERNAELERLLVETTEYINAQQMQLETMKQVNEQLQQEIRSLAKASLGKNEV